MMARLRVIWVTKNDSDQPHERIKYIGGAGWKYKEGDAIIDLEHGLHSFYVQVGNDAIDVIVATHLGRKYLKTKDDELSPDILLSLPESAEAPSGP